MDQDVLGSDIPSLTRKENNMSETQVSEAAFLKVLNTKKTAAAAAAKTERKGFLDDSAVLDKLGIASGESKTFHGSVSKIVMDFAKKDKNRPMFRFVYVIASDDKSANGTVVNNNFIIEDGVNKEGVVFRTEAEVLENLFQEFQSLGEDTTKWVKDPCGEAAKAAKLHTKEKTPVSITVKHWDNGKKSGMNVYANTVPVSDNSDLEDEVNEEEADDSDFDPEDWIGGYVTFTSEEYGNVRMLVSSYDADTETFSGTDDNGDDWEDEYAPLAKAVEWAEDQEPAE
jgi:hypothetical protein